MTNVKKLVVLYFVLFPFRYSKAENLTSGSKEMMTFTHLLLEAKSKYSQNLKPYSKTHDILDSVEGFSHIAFNYNTFPPIKIKTKPMIFILKRKGINVGKFGHTETEEEELQSGTEEVPTDTDILKSDVEQDLISESEAASEYDRRDETSEPENEISYLLQEKDNDMFVRPVTDDEGNAELESAFVELNVEPTEDAEEVQLSMRMSSEDVIKELNKAENKAKMYLKSGTVKRNIQKIIREYRAHEDEEQMKSEDSTKAQTVKQDADVQLRETEFSIVNEEYDNDMHAQGAREYTDQVTDKPGLDNHQQTGRKQETDHTAVDAEMNVDVSHVPSNSVTYGDHDTEGEKGKKGLKKLIKKYKMLDQSRGAEPPALDDRMTGNGTGHEKKPVQKIRPTQQIFKKDVLEEGRDFETITEPKETSVPTENETIENDNIELNGVKKIEEDTNQIVSEMYNDTPVSYVNLQDLDSGIIENDLPSHNSRHKKRATNKVIKELHGDTIGADISVAEEPGEVHESGNETPTPTNRKNPDIQKVNEKFISSDDTEHTPPPDNIVRNAGEIENMYEQDTPADEKKPTKNGIHMQEDDTVSDKIEPVANTAYLAQLPERSTEEYDTPTKETMIDAVHPKEILYEVSVGPEGLPLQSSASDDEKTRISEHSEDIKLSKQKSTSSEASQNAGNIGPVLRDKHKTESDERVKSENVAKRKLGEDIIQM